MKERQEPVTVTIKRIELRDVVLEGLSPLDITALAKEVENKMEEISDKKNTVDSFKLALYAALFYAAKAYSKDNTAQRRSKTEERQLDSAIDKLTMALERLPLK